MKNELIKTYKDLLHSPLPDLPAKSIFEIGGLAREEEIISKFYMFFLRNDKTHGLGTIFLDSLLAVAKRKKIKTPSDWQKYTVNREVPTKRGRIDLLIEEGNGKDRKAIIIENKINAAVTNDLEDYYNSIKVPDSMKVGLLIHHKPLDDNCAPFHRISHSEWMQEVRERITKANLRNFYALLALQLAEVFSKTNDDKKKIRNADKYGRRHSDKISDLLGSDSSEISIQKDEVEKAQQIIDIHQAMKETLFDGIRNSAYSLPFEEIRFRLLSERDLAMKFRVGKYYMRLVFCLDASNPNCILIVCLDVIKPAEMPTYILDRVDNSIKKLCKLSKLMKGGIRIDDEKVGQSYHSIARKDYSESELEKFGETDEMLLGIVNKDWLELLKYLERNAQRISEKLQR